MTRDSCSNTFYDDVSYIISEIGYQGAGWQARFKHRRSKDLLKPMSFDSMISELEEIYPSLHDINLHVHRVKKDRTIVDVRYYLKEKVEIEAGDKVPAMLHAKVSVPPYLNHPKEKFDVHWELGEPKHLLRLYCWKISFRLKHFLK